jgi:hypothetical protein
MLDKDNESEYAIYRKYRERVLRLLLDFDRDLEAVRNPAPKPASTQGLRGWDDMGTPLE